MMVEEKLKFNKLQLTEQQKEIFNGLKQIGPEIASFYLDGIRILKDSYLKTKANLLAHIAREIDGGLRDIFTTKIKQEICKECGKPLNSQTHRDSICAALGIEDENELSKEWLKISKRFHKFAHRNGAWKNPRDFEEFRDYWEKYELILLRLIGSYYNLLNRIDVILNQDIPSDKLINTLPNLFREKATEVYFFTNLNKLGWLKKLFESNFFDYKNNPEPQKTDDGYIYTPYWSALVYLEKIIKKTNESSEEMQIILNIIDNYIKEEEEKRRNNFRSNYSVFKLICELPDSKIKKEHLKFIEFALVSDFNNTLIAADIGKKLIPKLIKTNNKDVLFELLKIIIKYEFKKSALINEVVPIVDFYWLIEIFNKNEELINKYPKELISIILDNINSILKKSSKEFNNVQIPTIEDHSQTKHDSNYESFLIKILRDSYLKIPDKELLSFVEELLSKEHSIFRRIAYFIISKKYSQLKKIFWKIKKNPLNDELCTHEIYELLKINSQCFNDDEITKIVDWIESKDYFIPEKIKDNEDEIIKLKAYRKKEWLLALEKTDMKIIKDKLTEYNKISPETIEHPGFLTWHQSWAGHLSPINETELNSLSIKGIKEYLIDFKEGPGLRKPTLMGLGETFEKVVMNRSEELISNIMLFKEVQPIFKYHLINGIYKIVSDNQQIDWNIILKFLLEEAQKINISDEKNGFNYSEWLVAQIARLIEEGCKIDKEFDKSHNEEVIKLLLILAQKINSNLKEVEDSVTATLNTTKGKILSALLNLSLKIARNTDGDNKWHPKIKKFFHEELKDKPSIELYTTYGEYLVNFMYLDKKWIIENIKNIFNKEKKDGWFSAMQGYLFNLKVYKELFLLLEDNYAFAIDSDIKNKSFREKISAHICIAYLESWISFEDENSLITKLINSNYIIEISNFIWRHKHNLLDKKDKIKILLKKIFHKSLSNEELHEINNILFIFDELDSDIIGWLQQSIKTLEQRDNYQFLEFISRIIMKNPEESGELFLDYIVNAKFIPDYKQETIRKIVEELYSSGHKNLANKICEVYAKNNLCFLRDLFEKNQ